MDFSKLKYSEIVLDIKNPATGENLGLSVTLVSPDDDRVKKVKLQNDNERLVLLRRGKDFDAKKVDENVNKMLAACVTGWVWGDEAEYNGVKLDFTTENVMLLLKELPWFKKQIEAVVVDDANFFQI